MAAPRVRPDAAAEPTARQGQLDAERRLLDKARAALASGDTQLAESLVRHVEGQLDRAASKGVIHNKAASRVKSRLYTQLSKIAAG